MTFPSLRDSTARNSHRFGGKSAHLAGLAALGAPIPAGFAIPTDALLQWQQPLIPQIKATIDRLAEKEEQEVSHQIALLFQHRPLGAALRDQIATSCQAHLPGGLSSIVAVRSSAVGEDAAEASFAGQFESLLGVRGLDQIDTALRAVWASLYSARAIRYRHDTGLDAAANPMGVTVLEMVDAVASGVAFSVDVVTGKRDRVVIEATHALAEPLVQGQITPDRYVVDKSESRLMSLSLGRKSLLCKMNSDGGIFTTEATNDLQDAASLHVLEAESLAQVVSSLEEQMGHPIDIEWAFGTDGGLRLLQVRPISTVLPKESPTLWKRIGS